ncbi:MAG: hypothetical protein JSW06_02805 [Thermoplasmatales archaeon]|nr:MAG: hypothetical protein JSW06_02805 [Thermoplasmatales archaeon]
MPELNSEEYDFFVKLKENLEIDLQIKNKKIEMWIKVNSILHQSDYAKARKEIKDQYRNEIETLINLKHDI